MRTAVVIAGMLREAALAYPSWSFIGEDIHVTTWDVSLEGNNAVKAEPQIEPVSLASIPFPYVNACVLSYGMPLNPATRASFLWRHAEEELSSYETIHGQYDRVLLTRPDIFLNFDIALDQPLAEREVKGFSPSFRHPDGPMFVQDMCLLMHRSTFRLLHDFHAFRFTHPLTYDVHATLSDFFARRGLTTSELLDHGHRYCIVRKPSRGKPWEGDRSEMFRKIKFDADVWWIFHHEKLP